MTDNRLDPIALTMGDPAGCGPAIAALAWQALRQDMRSAFYLIGDAGLIQSVPVKEIGHPREAVGCFRDAVPCLASGLPCNVMPGRPDPASAPAIISAIETATLQALSGDAAAIVTNPINKALLYAEGFRFPGHTEFIAHLCAPAGEPTQQPVMMLVGGGLRVALATIHLPLQDVASRLSISGLIKTGQIVQAALRRDFGLKKPKLAFSGLNPHAGENGTLGREEIDTINPAAEYLRANGVDISDARPGDTVFAEALSGRFDAVIAMTHDQGLIPVKTLDFWGGVNTTLGLPIIRTSPDHGTAYDAAANGTCRADSLIAALRLARHMADRRQSAS